MSPARPLTCLTQVAAPARKVLSALVPGGALVAVAFLLLTRGNQLVAALLAVPRWSWSERCARTS